MSLTSMLRNNCELDKPFRDIIRSISPTKKQFGTISGSKPFSKEYSILVPYTLKFQRAAGIVGAGFDYLARVIIAQKIHNNKEQSYTNLIAEKGLKALHSIIKELGRKADKKLCNLLSNKYNDGIDKFKKYTFYPGSDLHELIPYACYFALLELQYRSPVITDVDDIYPNYIDGKYIGEDVLLELEKLCAVFQDVFFLNSGTNQQSVVLFNPNFGTATKKCGGADADIYIDGILYDFKTTRKHGYKWQDVAQLTGYYLLDRIAKSQNDATSSLLNFPIKRLAFYKARFGEIEYFDISAFDEPLLEKATDELALFLEKRHPAHLIQEITSSK